MGGVAQTSTQDATEKVPRYHSTRLMMASALVVSPVLSGNQSLSKVTRVL